MMWPQLEIVAQVAIGRVLNSLPEGLLIALFAGMMLRILPRQNAGTRFAAWFVALLSVAALPFIGAGTGAHSSLPVDVARPLITLPGPLGLILFLGWTSSVCLELLRLTTGLWRLRELRASCVEISATELDPAVRKTITDFFSSRSVMLTTSEKVSVPAVVGFFKPTIVLPAWALRELSPEELNIVLLHELAHVRRWDAWTNLLQKIVRAVFLFHPAVWWIERRMSLEREMACDDQVLAETENPRSYAKCLIALLEKSAARRGWAMAHAVVHRAREATLRLAQILDTSRPASRNVWKPALCLVAAFSSLCLMSVPRAPQIVTFARSAQTTHSDEAGFAPANRPPVPAAAVIPAALRMRPSSSSKKITQQLSARRVAHPLERRGGEPGVIAARWSGKSALNPSDESSGASNQKVPLASETLLIIQTTERVGPNSWVWSVGVWRVTLVNATRDGVANVPVAGRT